MTSPQASNKIVLAFLARQRCVQKHCLLLLLRPSPERDPCQFPDRSRFTQHHAGFIAVLPVQFSPIGEPVEAPKHGKGTVAHEYFLVRVAFFFNDTATTEIYTLSLHDALPI